MAIEHMKHWHVGDVRITRIYELPDQTDCSFLLPDATNEMVKRYPWLRPHFATPEGQIIVWFQAFLVTFGKRRIMVDTCVGNGRIREFELFTNTRTSPQPTCTARSSSPSPFTRPAASANVRPPR